MAKPAQRRPRPAPAPTIPAAPNGPAAADQVATAGAPADTAVAAEASGTQPSDAREIGDNAERPLDDAVEVRVLRDHGEHRVNDIATIAAGDVSDAETMGWACSHPASVEYARSLVV